MDKPVSAEELRRTAEARFSAQPVRFRGADEIQELVHELGVHQIELEMQNEQLRQTQVELAISRDRYSALYDNAPVGYLTIDRNGVIVESNLAAAALLGVDRERVLGLKLYSFMSPIDADDFHVQQLALLRGGKQSSELDLRRADGRKFRARLDSVADVEIAAGLRAHVALIDVTELREAQVDLQVSEARFQQIATHIQDVFYLRERDGVISYVSPAFEGIWGRSTSEIVGKPGAWLDTVDEEDRERVRGAWGRLRAGTPISEVYRIRRSNGTVRWVQSRGFPMGSEDGTPGASVGVVRDVTHERMLEQALRHAQKMEAVGTLASGVAHNLRNVLQAILGSVEVARVLTAAGQPAGQILDRATTTTKKGAALIDQLMMFARKQEATVSLSPVHLDDAIRDAAVLIKPLLGNAIALEIDAGAPFGVVMADRMQLEQIFLNLAANARDAMPRGGVLTIKSTDTLLDEQRARAHGRSPGPHVIVTVTDTGVGMDAATKARLFEPFFTTKEIGKGTGLGLSTVFALVQQFGGCIEVESAPGAGTAFTICLPSLQGPLFAGAPEDVDRRM